MKTILIVEDEVSIVELVRSILESEGYQTIAAGDGLAGLECLKTVRPDLVLCDVMMPRLDGRKLCKTMQAMPDYKDIPIVIMSALGENLIDDGCNYAAYLAKPFDLDQLLETVAQLIEIGQAGGVRQGDGIK